MFLFCQDPKSIELSTLQIVQILETLFKKSFLNYSEVFCLWEY